MPSFITNYIPNVGFIIGLIPPALPGLLDQGPSMMVAVIVAYSVVNFVVQSIIQPKVVGDVVDLATTLTFLSLVFWTWLIGPLGAVLAIPLTLLVKALLVDIDPATSWLTVLISAKPKCRQPRFPLRAGLGAATGAAGNPAPRAASSAGHTTHREGSVSS